MGREMGVADQENQLLPRALSFVAFLSQLTWVSPFILNVQEPTVFVTVQTCSTEVTGLLRRGHLLKRRKAMGPSMLIEVKCRHMYKLKKQTEQ